MACQIQMRGYLNLHRELILDRVSDLGFGHIRSMALYLERMEILKILLMNILDNFKGFLYCLYTFGVSWIWSEFHRIRTGFLDLGNQRNF